MIVKNKWNCNLYSVKCFDGPTDEVTLIREDGSELTIPQKEYKCNYYEVKDGKTDND